MPKKPSFQFYYGDWKRDAHLSKCSPSTRGIWMDLICDMHDLDQCGEIVGTIDQLARSCRCSPEEMSLAINELSVTKTADITKHNNEIHVINRRMFKEFRERKYNRIRQKRYRDRHCNDDITENNGKVTPPSSTSSSTSIQNRHENKFSNADLSTANWMFERLQSLNPDHKKPGLEKWANSIRLIRERDGKSDQEIRELFRWANNDPFWQTNILSPNTLRKQWDKLTIQKNKKQAVKNTIPLASQPEALDSYARQNGIKARPGESYNDLYRRCLEAAR